MGRPLDLLGWAAYRWAFGWAGL
uniref:Uncharacterized protein n=2 Tax=Oryza TaxID=4527 RepID=A0A0D3ELE6_9ORYZ